MKTCMPFERNLTNISGLITAFFTLFEFPCVILVQRDKLQLLQPGYRGWHLSSFEEVCRDLCCCTVLLFKMANGGDYFIVSAAAISGFQNSLYVILATTFLLELSVVFLKTHDVHMSVLYTCICI